MKNPFSTFNKVSFLRGRFWHWHSAAAMFPLQQTGQLQFSAEAQGYQVPILLIAGRQHYREIHKSYPITSRRELTEVLAFEYNDAGHTQHFVLSSDEHSQQVNSYIYDAAFVSQLPGCCLLLPESLLISYAFAPQVMIEVQSELSYFIYRHHSVQSMRQSQLCPDAERFRLAAGVPDDVPVQVLGTAELADVFERGISELPLRFLRAALFVNPGSMNLDWRPIGAAFAGGLLLAATLTIGTTQLLKNKHTAAIESYGAEIETLLTKQSTMEQMQADIKQLSEVISIQDYHLAPWQLAEKIQDKSLIQQMSVQGDVVILRGIALKATDVLKALLESGLVTEAVFDAPTVEDSGQETFVIKAKMRHQGPEHAK